MGLASMRHSTAHQPKSVSSSTHSNHYLDLISEHRDPSASAIITQTFAPDNPHLIILPHKHSNPKSYIHNFSTGQINLRRNYPPTIPPYLHYPPHVSRPSNPAFSQHTPEINLPETLWDTMRGSLAVSSCLRILRTQKFSPTV